MRTQVCTRRPAKPCRVPAYDCCDSEDPGELTQLAPPRRRRRSPLPTSSPIGVVITMSNPHLAPPRPAATAVAALIAAAASWGIGTVVTKQVVDDVTPLTLLPLQLAASCVFLLIVVLVRREPLTLSPSVRRLAALGVLNPGVAYALGLIGLTTITASMSVLLWALEPVVILLLAGLVLREHIPPALAACVGVAITGVLLVVYQPGAAGEAIGITLTLVSVGCCALYTVLTRRLMLDDSSLNVVLTQQAAALGSRSSWPRSSRWSAAPAGTWPASGPGRCWVQPHRGSCTTAWASSCSSPACVWCRRRTPARSCRSSRSSGSQPATWSVNGSIRGSGSEPWSSWPRSEPSRGNNVAHRPGSPSPRPLSDRRCALGGRLM